MADMRYRAQSLVFRNPPPAAEAEAERFAEALGWPFVGTIPRDADRGIQYEVQWAAGPAISLHYLVDDLSMAAHLTISGTDRSRVDATRALAERHLDVVSFGDLLRSIEKQQTIRNQGRALIRAGVGAPPEFDKRLAKAIKKFLRSDDPVLREAALFTMSYVPAAQYRAFLDEAAQQDPDERLRQTARGILAAYDKGGVPR